jgi:dTDP-4-amino-4,6-dideoxygalactose transaminase
MGISTPLQVPAGLPRLQNPYSLAQNLPYQPVDHDLLL